MESKNITTRSGNTAGKIANTIGRGLIAGLAGTAAITIAQTIEMKITNRKGSGTTYKAAGKVLGFKPRSEEEKGKLSNIIHFGYGTAWGLFRSVMSSMGVKGAPATAAHLAAIWGTEMTMLPSLDVSSPPQKWGAKAIAKDGLFHGIYALAAGFTEDKLRKYSC